MTTGELFRWRAWAAVANPEGGVFPAGSVYIATERDPRVLADRSKRLGPHVPEPTIAEPAPPSVAEAFGQA